MKEISIKGCCLHDRPNAFKVCLCLLTQADLKVHVELATYKVGVAWAKATDPQLDNNTPPDYGWIEDGDICA